jgi:hypothetical protein
MVSQAWHDLAHGRGRLAEIIRWPVGPLIAGTPMWAKAAMFSSFGRMVELTRVEIWIVDDE